MRNGDERLRVYNRCQFDIGVKLLNGIGVSIKPGSFQVLSVNEILYIESICARRKLFASKLLVPVDAEGKDIAFEDLGLYPDEESSPHLNDAEIESLLKQSVKKVEAWLEKVDDPVELHAVYKVAKNMDLPSSKLKLLSTKMPEKEWLEK